MSKKRKGFGARSHLPNSQLADWCLHVNLCKGSTMKEKSDFETSILFRASRGGSAKVKAVPKLQSLVARINFLYDCDEKMRIDAFLAKLRKDGAPAYRLKLERTFYKGIMTEHRPSKFFVSLNGNGRDGENSRDGGNGHNPKSY